MGAVCAVAIWLGLVAPRAEAESLIRALPPTTPVRRLPCVSEPDEVLLYGTGGADLFAAPVTPCYTAWTLQILPEGLIYKSYLAGGREPRMASQWAGVDDGNSVWDITLGGRVGILRYGSDDPLWPEGWQIDFEGAAFPRLTLDTQRDLVAADFRAGVPITYRQGPWETKFAYYHLSAHLGDEFLLRRPDVERINYARDVLVLGLGWRPHDDWRFYGEAGWAFYTDGGAEPWEFQFGAEFSPARSTTSWGAPFLAVNSRLREEVDFGGNLTAQAGWQWRGPTGRLLRLGFHYFNGHSDQFQFHEQFEEQYAVGLWYDF